MKDQIITKGIDLLIPPPAKDFVKINHELSGCGRYTSGAWAILLNTHINRKIRVIVVIKWRFENIDHSDTLPPIDIEPSTSINLGCNFWRGDFELQEFKRNIVDAYYL